MDGRYNRGNKVAFSDFSSELRTRGFKELDWKLLTHRKKIFRLKNTASSCNVSQSKHVVLGNYEF